MINLVNDDIMKLDFRSAKFNLIFADLTNKNYNFSWIDKYWNHLLENGVFIVRSDYYTKLFKLDIKLKSISNSFMINHNSFIRNQSPNNTLFFSNGKNYKFYFDRVQTSTKLLDRIILPFVDKDDFILDLFMGYGSLAEWSFKNGINYVGIEKDKEIFRLAGKRLGLK